MASSATHERAVLPLAVVDLSGEPMTAIGYKKIDRSCQGTRERRCARQT